MKPNRVLVRKWQLRLAI